MDIMQKYLGGRKFLMAILVTGIATFIEVYGRGLTPTMAAFLAGILGAFSAANYATTAKHMNSKNAGQSDSGGDVANKLDVVQETLLSGLANPETLNNLLSVLGKMKVDMEQLKDTTGQLGKAVVNLGSRRN